MVNKVSPPDKIKQSEQQNKDNQLSAEGLSVDELSSADFSYDPSVLGITNPVVQKKGGHDKEEEKPLQFKSEETAEVEQEEPVQMKGGHDKDEDKPLQFKSEESAEVEAEEPVQKKGGHDKEEDKPLQFKSGATKAEAGSQESARGTLPVEVRAKMENSFSTDFSNVKIHADSSKASNIGALAYTQGNEIHFAPGQYQPHNKKGQELLGHELTHVVQQRGGRVQQTTQAKGMAVNDDTVLEREADVMGEKAANGEKNVSVGEKNGPVESHIVQGYFISNKGSKSYRVADDLSAAVKEGYPNHLLYAKSGKVAASNNALAAAGSGIKLIEQSQKKTFKKGGVSETLKRVVPKNITNNTKGSKMKLWADCSKSNSVVVGGTNRKAGYEEGGVTKWTNSTNPSGMKAEIMQSWLTNKYNDGKTTVPEKLAIKRVLDEAKVIEGEMNIKIGEYAKAATEAEKTLIIKSYFAKMDAWAEKLWSYYNTQSDSTKDSIDKELGVNKYAKPSVGEGYTTSSGGAGIHGYSTWNFHWGGVVMESTDTNDKIILENYAVGDPSVENKDWEFAMYGTVKDDQSFHEQHKATNQHGASPTTMRIDNK